MFLDFVALIEYQIKFKDYNLLRSPQFSKQLNDLKHLNLD